MTTLGCGRGRGCEAVAVPVPLDGDGPPSPPSRGAHIEPRSPVIVTARSSWIHVVCVDLFIVVIVGTICCSFPVIGWFWFGTDAGT